MEFEQAIELYDRRTRAAYEVMGRRWTRFQRAKDAFLAAEPGTSQWFVLAAHMYRLGLRSTHAYYLWTEGHAAQFAPLELPVADAALRLRAAASGGADTA